MPTPRASLFAVRALTHPALRAPVAGAVRLRVNQPAALLLLLLFSPLMLVVAAMNVRGDGGPVLFGHYRVGMRGRLFRCLKFRSMHIDSQRMLSELLERD